MKLIIKLLKSEQGSVFVGGLLTAAGTAAAGALGAKAVGGLLGGSADEKAQATSAYDPNNPQFADIQRAQQAAALAQGGMEQYGAAGGQGLQGQQAVLAQLLAQAQGQGPNPAAIALKQATGQNVANQAALVAGQGGINTALAARMAGQQGAAIQQQAAGQGALMQAQQQLAAQQAAGALGGQLVGQGMQSQDLFQRIAAQNAGLAQADAASLTAAQSGTQRQGMANAGALTQQVTQGLGTGLAALGSSMNKTPEVQLSPVAATGGTPGTLTAAHGGKIPGKALKPGDDEENDVVPVLLSPGEIVVPRSFASDPKAAAAFAHACALFSEKKGK